jgi:hypothetical protein
MKMGIDGKVEIPDTLLLSGLYSVSRHDGNPADNKGGPIEPLMRARLPVGRFELRSEGRPFSS